MHRTKTFFFYSSTSLLSLLAVLLPTQFWPFSNIRLERKDTGQYRKQISSLKWTRSEKSVSQKSFLVLYTMESLRSAWSDIENTGLYSSRLRKTINRLLPFCMPWILVSRRASWSPGERSNSRTVKGKKVKSWKSGVGSILFTIVLPIL